jgi:hypothetical protein
MSNIRINIDGEVREVEQADFAEFISKKTKVPAQTPADLIRKALEPTTRDEYVGLLGDNPYREIYMPEINRFLQARCDLRTKTAEA